MNEHAAHRNSEAVPLAPAEGQKPPAAQRLPDLSNFGSYWEPSCDGRDIGYYDANTGVTTLAIERAPRFEIAGPADFLAQRGRVWFPYRHAPYWRTCAQNLSGLWTCPTWMPDGDMVQHCDDEMLSRYVRASLVAAGRPSISIVFDCLRAGVVTFADIGLDPDDLVILMDRTAHLARTEGLANLARECQDIADTGRARLREIDGPPALVSFADWLAEGRAIEAFGTMECSK